MTEIRLDLPPSLDEKRFARYIHRAARPIEWNPARLIIMSSMLAFDAGKNGGYMDGRTVLASLQDFPVLNANACDFLLQHPEELPKEDWLKIGSRNLCFLGTKYQQHKSDSDEWFVPCITTFRNELIKSDVMVNAPCWDRTILIAGYVGLEVYPTNLNSLCT